MAKKKDTVITIDPNEIRVRDELIMALINGATKSGIQQDVKKEKSKKKCRQKVTKEDDNA